MSLLTSNIPNLVNGISQQPYALRMSSQGERQVNGLSSIVEGLRKRPQTRHSAKIRGTQVDNAYVHIINRDTSEQYVTVLGNGWVEVYDLQGVKKTVAMPNGAGYLSSTNPKEDFAAVTVADYTFILNKGISAASASTLSAGRNDEALIWIKQGAYGAKFTATVNGVTKSYTTPDGSMAEHSTQIATDYIATQLRDQFSTALGTDYVTTTRGSVIYIRRDVGSGLTVSGSDSLGNTSVVAIGKKIQRFSELPSVAYEGFEVEITGDNTSQFDNYYVKYQDGVWTETCKQDERIALDTTTMPHALVREADGTFTFREITWDQRQVGDLESNPMPSFVGRKINDIFFHRNRLGFVADENVIMSKAGDYWAFFRGTATQVLDDDPIDIGVSHVKVSIIRHAIPFNETLLLFSDQTQFQLGRADVLTPDTVSINQTTEYECSLRAKPQAAGRFVYFMVNRGGHSGVREYFVDGTTEVEEAADVSGHIPKYIPGDVFKLATSSNEDVLVLLSEQEPSKLYVYRYYWNDQEKIQASWSHWEFDNRDQILNIEFIESDLYLIVQRSDGVHIEVMSLEPGRVEPGLEHPVHLDSLVDDSLTVDTYYAADDRTSIELPYKIHADEQLQLVTNTGGSRVEGRIIPYELDNTGVTSVLWVDGDFVGQPFYVGKVYRFEYTFSQLALREGSSGGGEVTVSSGRTQLRKLAISYANSGYFTAEVTPYRRDTYQYVFSGRIVGSARNALGKISIEDGIFPVPLMAKNDQVEIKLINESFLPSAFLSAEWECYFTTRSKRM